MVNRVPGQEVRGIACSRQIQAGDPAAHQIGIPPELSAEEAGLLGKPGPAEVRRPIEFCVAEIGVLSKMRATEVRISQEPGPQEIGCAVVDGVIEA